MEIKPEELDERNILIGLIVNDKYIEQVDRIYKSECLESNSAKLLAGWCLEYFKQYGKAPGKDIESIFANKLKDGSVQQEDADFIEGLLSGLSKEYDEQKEAMINVDFRLDNTVKHFQECQLKEQFKLERNALLSVGIEEVCKLRDGFQLVTLSDLHKEVITNAGEQYLSKEKTMNWLIKDLIPKGLTILGGKSRTGKSSLMVYTSMALVQGKYMFGKDGEPKSGFRGQAGQILYLSLEDHSNRFNDRMRKSDADPNIELLANLKIAHSWKKLNQGGLRAIEKWIEQAKNPKLVIIDTMAKVWDKKSNTSGANLYSEEYRIFSPLSDLAHKHDVSIVALTHTTKKEDKTNRFNEILGGSGTQAPSDNMILLRKIHDGTISFSIQGKDIDDSFLMFSVENEGAVWTYEGEEWEIQKTKQRQELFDLIKEEKSISLPEIKQKVKENELNISLKSVNLVIRKMVADGILEQNHKRGEYSIAGYQNNLSNSNVASKTKQL